MCAQVLVERAVDSRDRHKSPVRGVCGRSSIHTREASISMSRLIVWASFLILSLHGAGYVAAQALDPEEILTKAIENRQKIKSYDISVMLDYGEEIRESAVTRARLVLDGKSFRVDLNFPYAATHRFDGLNETDFWDRTVYTPTQVMRFNSMLLPGPGQRVAQVDTEPDRVHADYREALNRLDIRSLGFHTTGITTGCDLAEFLRDLALPGKTASQEVLNGIECVRVTWKIKSGVECDFWFAPGFGYAPVKARGHYPPFESTDEIELTLEESNQPGIWFPTSYRSSRKYSATSQEFQNAKIVVHSINEQIEPTTFELAGLEIPVGRSVRTLPSHGPKQIWDGEKAVLKGSREMEHAPNLPKSRSFLYLLNGIIACVLAVFFFRQATRATANTRSQGK